MSTTNAQAAAPMGREYRPRFHGPGRKRFPTRKTRMKIGIVNATKAATAAMLKIALMAYVPPKISRVRRIPIAVLNQTALTGVLVWWVG